MSKEPKNPNGCSCLFCKTYHKYKWAVIMECKCNCHIAKEPSGHDALCCEFPNGKKKDNPYTNLESAETYLKIINDEQTDQKPTIQNPG